MSLTWRHTGGNSGCGHLALALGGHGCHLDGVSGESREAGHLVLLGQVGQIMGHPRVGPVKLLPGDAIAWRKRQSDEKRSWKQPPGWSPGDVSAPHRYLS